MNGKQCAKFVFTTALSVAVCTVGGSLLMIGMAVYFPGPNTNFSTEMHNALEICFWLIIGAGLLSFFFGHIHGYTKAMKKVNKNEG